MKLSSPDQLFETVKKHIHRNEWIALAVSFLFSALVFLPMMVMRLNTSDGNLCGILYRSHLDYDWEDYCGRFLIKYLAHLRSLYVMNWFAMLLSLLWIIMGTLIICRVLKIDSLVPLILSSLFMVMSPALLQTYPFYYLSDGFTLAFLLSAMAVYLIHKKMGLIRILSAAFLLACSLALYQAYFFVAVTVFTMLFILRVLNQEQSLSASWKLFWKQIFVSALGAVFYFCADKILKAVGLIFYNDSRFHVADSFTPKALLHSVAYAYRVFYQYFFTMDLVNNLWKKRGIVHGFYFLCVLVIIAAIAVLRKLNVKEIVSVALMVALLPLAITGIAVVDTADLVRPMMIPASYLLFVFGFAVWKIMTQADRKILTTVTGWGIYLSAFYLVFTLVILTGIFQLEKKYYVDKFNALCGRVVTRIENEYPDWGTGKTVFFYGIGQTGNLGSSYEIELTDYITKGLGGKEVLSDNPHDRNVAWVKYLSANYGTEYSWVDRPFVEEMIYSSEFAEHGSFPEKDSIWLTDSGVLIIKIDELQ